MTSVLASLLEDLFQRNETTPCSLRGGAYCANIERVPDGEPWVQAKTGVLNIFFPSDDDPIRVLNSRLPSLPAGTTCPDWEPWKYATLETPQMTADQMADLITDLFVSFYEFPDDTPLQTEIFDVR
jgi:hypothetical protein